MKDIRYTSHLEFRLKWRDIPYTLPQRIYKTAKERYIDQETGKSIAASKTKYKGKVREFIVVYEEVDKSINLITIHPLKPYQKQNRIQSGRWQKL